MRFSKTKVQTNRLAKYAMFDSLLQRIYWITGKQKTQIPSPVRLDFLNGIAGNHAGVPESPTFPFRDGHFDGLVES